MNPTLKNVLIVFLGIIIGGAVNMFLITISGNFIPLPEGVDPTDEKSLAAGIHLFEAKHFIMPFLAHALGTLIASFIIARFATKQHLRLALLPGFLFLIGGIMMSRMLDAPTWFDALDLLVAYLPMAYLGYMLGRKK